LALSLRRASPRGAAMRFGSFRSGTSPVDNLASDR
jgi:hypothetical protein